MKAKRTVNPIALAVASVTIALGNSDNILKTMRVMGERIHRNVARAIQGFCEMCGLG